MCPCQLRKKHKNKSEVDKKVANRKSEDSIEGSSEEYKEYKNVSREEYEATDWEDV